MTLWEEFILERPVSPSYLRSLDTYMWSNKGPKAGNTTDLKYVYYLILKTQITDELWIAVRGVIECPEQSSFWEMFHTAYISLIIYSRTYKNLGDIQKCNIDHSEHIQEINIVLLVVLPLGTCSLLEDRHILLHAQDNLFLKHLLEKRC